MPAYDAASFDPSSASGKSRPPPSVERPFGRRLPMVIDSGADVALLPRSSLATRGVDPATGEEYELAAFDGTTSVSRAVSMHLLFLRRTFRGRFLTTEGNCGILGRDIINHLAILHNGPKLEWSEGNR